MKRRSEIVSFRADAELTGRIDRVREVFDISRGDWVKGLVTAHLGQFFSEDPNECLEQVNESLGLLAAETEQTKTMLKQILFIVLTVGCEVSPEKAKESVRKMLLAIEREG